jgi:hypothetical protein
MNEEETRKAALERNKEANELAKIIYSDLQQKGPDPRTAIMALLIVATNVAQALEVPCFTLTKMLEDMYRQIHQKTESEAHLNGH